MRFLSLSAFLALPLILLTTGPANANPLESRGFGCGGVCLGMFPNIHQHGPLFNYGPYFGYYPFKPYGPWDQYLRYDPFFYGDPYANWRAAQSGCCGGKIGFHGSLLHHGCKTHHDDCKSCGFSHASWSHGGWFHGHTWLHGNGHHDKCKPACSTCGGVTVPVLPPAPDNPMSLYSGFGSPAQSVVFYPATPALNPALEVVQTAGQVK
jgi:hypothetical protein